MGAEPDISTQAFFNYLVGVQSKGTATKYAKYAAAFLALMKENGYASFSALPPDILADLSSSLTRRGLGGSAVRVHIYAVKKYLEWVEGKGIKMPQQARVELPKRQLRLRPVLPPERFTDYFRQADMYLEEPVRTAVMLLPCCGLRAQEMVTLNLNSVLSGRVTMRNGKQKDTLFIKVMGKGKKERSVPLMEEGVEILTGYLMGWRRRQKKSKWLFPNVSEKDSPGSNHIVDRYLRMGLQTLRESMSMDDDFTPHMMRRTYLTTLYKKGVALEMIAKIAGHTSIQTTLDHYIVMDPTDSLNALYGVGASLTG